MNGYDFVASIFQSIVSLAWPAAFVAAVWLFRSNIAPLLPKLRLKYKDIELSFRLEQAEKEAAQIPPADEVPEPTPEETARFEKLAELSPRAAMLEARVSLEQTAREVARAVGIPQPEKLPLHVLIRELRSRELMDPKTSALIDDLRALGNQAAHDSSVEITPKTAKRFWILTETANEQLTRMLRAG